MPQAFMLATVSKGSAGCMRGPVGFFIKGFGGAKPQV